jgi:hypothetical protein
MPRVLDLHNFNIRKEADGNYYYMVAYTVKDGQFIKSGHILHTQITDPNVIAFLDSVINTIKTNEGVQQ